MTYNKLFIHEQVIATCANYRADAETCNTGCPASRVMRGNMCPWSGHPQNGKKDCKCYR